MAGERPRGGHVNIERRQCITAFSLERPNLGSTLHVGHSFCIRPLSVLIFSYVKQFFS